MHSWGRWPDALFEQVSDSADEIGAFCARWGRIVIACTKEKFGTARVYVTFGFCNFHALVFPYHQWYHKWWPCKLDFFLSDLLSPIINPILYRWQKFIYRKAYSLAIKKRPHLKAEILDGADWHEYLEGL